MVQESLQMCMKNVMKTKTKTTAEILTTAVIHDKMHSCVLGMSLKCSYMNLPIDFLLFGV